MDREKIEGEENARGERKRGVICVVCCVCERGKKRNCIQLEERKAARSKKKRRIKKRKKETRRFGNRANFNLSEKRQRFKKKERKKDTIVESLGQENEIKTSGSDEKLCVGNV